MLFAFIAPAVHAAQSFTAYVCDFRVMGQGIRYVVALDQSGKAYVLDVQHGSTQPKLYPVTIHADGPNHYAVIYSFMAEAGDSHTTWTAKIHIPRKGGAARISFDIMGYYDKPRGNGTCAVEKNARLP